MSQNWRIRDARYCYTIYPDIDTPAELHNKMVYSIYLTCLDDNYRYGDISIVYEDHATIEVFGFVHNGELQILTGAVSKGESLVTFEGYKSIDEYISSLQYRVEYPEFEYDEYGKYGSEQYAIEGSIVTLKRCRVIITEPGYGVSYTISLFEDESGKYISRASVIDEYLFIHDEEEVPDGFVSEKRYQRTFCNGIYTVADFEWIDTHTYYAIKIGDIFYDYDDYYDYY